MTYGHLRLTACTPGSGPGPTLGIEYGKPLPLPYYINFVHTTTLGGDYDGGGTSPVRLQGHVICCSGALCAISFTEIVGQTAA